MTPEQFLTFRREQTALIRAAEDAIDSAEAAAEACPLPRFLRPATKADVKEEAVVWYPADYGREDAGPHWVYVGKVYPGETEAGYFMSRSTYYWFDGAFVECATEEEATLCGVESHNLSTWEVPPAPAASPADAFPAYPPDDAGPQVWDAFIKANRKGVHDPLYGAYNQACLHWYNLMEAWQAQQEAQEKAEDAAFDAKHGPFLESCQKAVADREAAEREAAWQEARKRLDSENNQAALLYFCQCANPARTSEYTGYRCTRCDKPVQSL